MLFSCSVPCVLLARRRLIRALCSSLLCEKQVKSRITFATIIVAFSVLLANAQQPSLSCKSPVEYGNRNQVDPKRSSVRGISGRVMMEAGNPAKELGAIPACLGLFTEKGHHLIASAVADEEGRFKFKPVPSGRYRLVVRDPQNSFCIANMPLNVARRRRGKARLLVIHMRPAGLDDCSYGDFK
jgi:hypothetical protein